MTRTVNEFRSEAGNIFVTRDSDIDPFEVWFEDFYMLGKGRSELEALQDAALTSAHVSLLLAMALNSVSKGEREGWK